MADLRVILLEDISKLGRAGDIVSVSEGYARNALFPSARAALATDQVTKQVKAKRAQEKKQQALRLQQLQETASILEGTELTISVRVKEGGSSEIYGSVTKKQLAEELYKNAHVEVPASSLTIEEAPIKMLGSYPMTVALSPDVDCNIVVQVIANSSSLNKIKSHAQDE